MSNYEPEYDRESDSTFGEADADQVRELRDDLEAAVDGSRFERAYQIIDQLEELGDPGAAHEREWLDEFSK